MSIKITYHCDRCKASQDTEEQMWNVAFYVNHYPKQPDRWAEKLSALWCRKCCEETGLLGMYDQPKPAGLPIQPLTLEELLRELVRDELQTVESSR